MGNNNKIGAAMVVGGGIGGMQAALDLAKSGIKVYLLEKSPCIGGVMSQLDKTFPTNDCSMCIMAPKLVEVGRHKDIEIITLADVENISGEPGHFTVHVKKRPRYIDVCTNTCPVGNQIYIIPEEDREKVVLEPGDEQVVRNILNMYRDEKGAIMYILQKVNETFRYLPKDILKFISQELDFPLSVIYRIATFYNAFSLTPVGRHIIHICMGTTCYVRGATLILNRLADDLGIGPEQTTEDMCFTLKSVRCLGCCSLAPVMTVDGKTYGRVKTKEIPLILKDYK
jgi:NADH:ubiquinone oxidoreductase subunit E